LLLELLEPRHLLTATVQDLHLLNGTGDSSTVGIASDPQIGGTVQGDFSGYAQVEFDHNADDRADGYTYVYSSGSQFTYDPRSFDYSLAYFSGDVTLRYRTIEYDSSYNAVTGPWGSFSFTLEQPTEPEITVSYTDTYEVLEGQPAVSTVTLSPAVQEPVAVSYASTTATVTLHDEDVSAAAGVSIHSVQDTAEGSTRGYFRLQRTGTLADELTVHYRIDAAHTSATNGTDVIPLSGTTAATNVGTFVFPADMALANLEVNPLDDGSSEGEETIRIVLEGGAADYFVDGVAAASVMIVDNDQPPVVTLGEMTDEQQSLVLPRAAGGTWTLTLGDQTTGPLRPDASALAVQDALEKLDRVAVGNVRVTGDGSPTAPFLVTFRRDQAFIDEPELSVQLADLVGIASAAASVTTETDGRDGLNEVVEVCIESRDGATPLQSGEQVRWLLGTAPGAAPEDWVSRMSAPIAWDATPAQIQNALEALGSVATHGGAVAVTEVESTPLRRRLRVELGGRLANQDVADLSLIADDAAGVVDAAGQAAVLSANVLQSGTAGPDSEVQVLTLADAVGGTFTVSLAGFATGAICTQADGTAVQAALEALPSVGAGNVRVTGAAGGPWQVTFQGDLAGTAIPSASLNTAGALSGIAVVSTVVAGGSVTEAVRDTGENQAAGAFRVFRTGAMDAELAVNYLVASQGTASEADDYGTLSGTVVIPAGQRGAEIVVMPVNDGSLEPSEAVMVTLAPASTGPAGQPAYTVGASSLATLTIADDDLYGPRPPVTIVAVSDAQEGGPAGVFRISRLGRQDALTVSYAVDPVSTAVAGRDYSALAGSVTLPAGQSTIDIAVAAVNDLEDEDDHTLRLVLTGLTSDAYFLAEPTAATLYLRDDDEPPALATITISDLQDAAEGGQSGYVRVHRQDLVHLPLTVRYSISSTLSTAENGADVELLAGTTSESPLQGTIALAAGQVTADLLVRAIDDTASEGRERLRITLVEDGRGLYRVGTPGTGTILIVDNDTAVPVPQVAALGLLHDTGLLASDRSTCDPTLTGMVTGDLQGGTVRLEFDHTGDNQTDGQVVVTTAGAFTYDPRVSDPEFNDPLGPRAVRYRALHFGADGVLQTTGSWRVFAFRLEEDPTVGAVHVRDLRLERDTGWNDDDRVTVHPVVIGDVWGDFQGGTVRLEFDLQNDGAPDAQVSVAQAGDRFRYDPRETDATLVDYVGPLEFAYRLQRLDAGGQVVASGEWTPFALTLESPPASERTVEGLSLRTPDPDVPFQDLVVAGQVAGQGSGSGSGSDSGDCRSGGSGYAASSSPPDLYQSFSVDGQQYEPQTSAYFSGAGSGSYWGYESYSNSFESNSFDYSWTPEPAGRVEDAVPLPSDACQASPNSQVYVTVEFDHDGDGAADGQIVTDGQGQFSYRPRGLGYGEHTIRARVAEWDTDYAAYRYGPWSTYTFVCEPGAGPEIGVLSLAHDDGSSSTDGQTTDATLVGELHAAATERSNVVIEFDHDGDDSADGTTLTDENGGFTYLPQHLPRGAFTVRARALGWNPVAQETLAGAWTSVTFTLVAPVAPPISTLTLLADTGESNTDRVTYVDLVVGALADGSSTGQVTIQFDRDGDGTPDSTVRAQTDGQFLYDPPGLTPGTRVLFARSAVWDGNEQQYVVGPWTQIAFTLQIPASEPASLSAVGLLRDTGVSDDDGLTADPTLAGTVANDGSVAQLTVEFDTNGDGIADGQTTTDAAGHFTYVPQSLPLGAVTVAVRVSEYDIAARELRTSAWSTTSFTMQAPATQPVAVSELRLLSDSGPSSSDGYTANATIAGQLAADAPLAGVLVEIDRNGDGTPDGQTNADAEGRFRYEPQSLPYGAVAVQVRAVAWSHAAASYVPGAWTPLQFVHENQPNAAPRLQALTVAAGSAATPSPVIQGAVTNEGALEQLTVEFDCDGDGTVDGSIQTDADGRFSFSPAGLPGGTVTIQVRTREQDSVTRQILRGDWQSLTFTNTVTVPPVAQVTQLALVHDAGSSATGGATTDAQVTGQVSTGGSQFLVVEFDHNGDGQPDGQVVTDAQGAFQYSPAGLTSGPVTLRARTRDYDHTANVVRGDWFSLNFTWQDPNGGPTLTTFHLTNDSGTSATDGSTDDDRVTGQVPNPFGTTSVQFDLDGDGAADAYSYVAYEGTFHYDPPGLTQGWHTIAARAVSYGSGTATPGPWQSLSYLVAEDPDSATAQALVSAQASFTNQWQLAQTQRNNLLTNANQQQATDQAAADSSFDGQVQLATATRNVAVQFAQSTYQGALATANNAYVTAVQAAATAFQSSLAAYAGDTTSYPFNGFGFSQSAPQDPWTFPTAAEQPPVPGAAPTDAGPDYNWDADVGYQAAIRGAAAAYQQDISAADHDRRTARDTAQDLYNQQVQDANDDYHDARQAAIDDYWDTFDDDHPTLHLRDEINAHYQRVQQAYDDYTTDATVSWNAYVSAAEVAHNTLRDAADAAWDTYGNNVKPSWDNYGSIVLNPASTVLDRFGAYVSASQTSFNEGLPRDRDISDATHQYDQDIADALRTYQQQFAGIEDTRQEAIHDSLRILDDKIAERNAWLKTRAVAAAVQLDKDLADAKRDREQARADAERNRADAWALAERDYRIALGGAQATRSLAEVSAQRDALGAWQTAVTTPWTTYQLAVADHLWQFTTAVGAAQVISETAQADAVYLQDQAISLAAHDRDHAAAGNDWQQTTDRAAERETYLVVQIGQELAERQGVHQATKDWLDRRSDKARIRREDSADIGHTYALARSDASYQCEQDQIDSRIFEVSSDPYGYSWNYYGGQWWTRVNIDVHDTVDHYTDQNHALADAYHTYARDSLDIEEAYGLALIADDQIYVSDVQTAASNAVTNPTAREDYLRAIGQIDEGHAIRVVTLQGAYANAVADAEVAYSSAAGPAQKTYLDFQAQRQAIRDEQDATSQRDFQVAQAGSLLSAVIGWDTAVHTPWSTYQRALAQAEFDAVTATGLARIDYAYDQGTAQVLLTAAGTSADVGLANQQALANHSHVDKLVTAQNAYATQAGQHKLDYLDTLIADGWVYDVDPLANLPLDGAYSNSYGGYTSSANGAAYRTPSEVTLAQDTITQENDFGRAILDAQHDFASAVIDAGHDYHIRVGEAAFDLEHALITHQQYLQECELARQDQDIDYEAANTQYKNDVQGAWSALLQQQADRIHRRVLSQYATGPSGGRPRLYAGAVGAAFANLADDLRIQAIDLATDKADADRDFAQQMADATRNHAAALAGAQATYRGSMTLAQTTLNTALDHANSAQREAEAAALGDYEVAVYQQHATDLQALATASGTAVAHYHAQVATANANWAALVRTARNLYHDALTLASANCTLAANSAETHLTTDLSAVNAAYDLALRNAQWQSSVDTGNAAADLYLGSATAEAVYNYAVVAARVDYEQALSDAWDDYETAFQGATLSYSTSFADAQRQIYLDATDNTTYVPSWYGWPEYSYGLNYYYYNDGYRGTGHYGGGGLCPGGYVFTDYQPGYWGLYGWGWGMGLDWLGWGWVNRAQGWHYWSSGYGADATENQAYQNAITSAAATYFSGLEAARLQRISDAGDAQIQRATDLGDARIQLATDRGAAGIVHAAEMSLARTNYRSTVATAENARAASLNLAQNTYVVSMALADQAQAGALANADVGWQYDRGVASGVRATGTATARANYEIAAAAIAASLASALAATTTDPADQFQAAYRAAQLQWVTAMNPAYIAHQKDLANADAGLAYDLAVADGTRRTQRAAADYTYKIDSAAADGLLAAASVALEEYFADQQTDQENIQAAALAGSAKGYEIAIAAAEKQAAIDEATAAKQYQLDVAHGVPTASQDLSASQADATRNRAESVADAKFDLLQAAATARKNYAVGVALAEQNRTLGRAASTRAHAIVLAGHTATREGAYATAEGAYAAADVTAHNVERVDRGTADSAFWTASYSEAIPAATALHAAVNLPWTGYLVAWSNARQDWWSTMEPSYQQWIDDRNTQESNYQSATAAARTNEATTVALARALHDGAVALAEETHATARANARYDYVFNLADDAEVYLWDAAQGERDYAVALADAARDYADHQDSAGWQAYQQAVDQALQDKTTWLDGIEDAFAAAETSELSPRLSAEAQAEHDYTLALAGAAASLAGTRATQDRMYREAEADAYLSDVTHKAALDATYWLAEAQVMAAELAALATLTMTPWAIYDAAESAAYVNWVAAVAPAKETSDVAQATAQRNYEVALAYADEGFALGTTTADLNAATLAADAQLLAANTEASAVAALAGSGTYKPHLPTSATAPDLGTSYAVPDLTVVATYSYSVSGVYWGGAYNSGGGFLQYGGGYSEYWMDSRSGYVPGTPEFVLEPGFWDLAGETSKVRADQTRPVLPESLGDVRRSVLEPDPDLQLPGAVAPAPQFASNALLVSGLNAGPERQEVTQLLESLDSDVAAFWRAHGGIQHVPFQDRPGIHIGAESGIGLSSQSKLNGEADSSASLQHVDLAVPHSAPSADVADQLLDRTAANDDRDGVACPLSSDSIQNKFQIHLASHTISTPGLKPGRSTEPWLNRNIFEPLHVLNGGYPDYKTDWVERRGREVRWFQACIADPGQLRSVRVGTLEAGGWVYFDKAFGGGRATWEALVIAARRYKNAVDTNIQDAINGIRSPYQYNVAQGTVRRIGIFIDGTDNFLDAQTNVTRLYNLYSGSKYYYGGLGNAFEYPELLGRFTSGAMANGWQRVLDRAEADILNHIRKFQPSTSLIAQPDWSIDIFGFSRGGAMANELARRLSKRGIEVHFLGMFDPVYSYALPGQSSWYVHSIDRTRRGNYVDVWLPQRVRTAAVIYAQHEERTWFPATRFEKENKSTRLNALLSPGVHSDIGGHWTSNPNIQRLTLYAMADFARRQGVPLVETTPDDGQLRAFFTSKYAEGTVRRDLSAKQSSNQVKDWLDFVRNTRMWQIMTQADFNSAAATDDSVAGYQYWAPGGYGAQANDAFNYAFFMDHKKQPCWNQMPRNFRDWYDSGDPGVKQFSDVFGIARQPFEEIGKLRANPNGKGWR
jgi:hypothetical protein